MTGGRAAADTDLQSPEPVVNGESIAPSTLRQRLVLTDAVTVGVGLALAFAWQALVRNQAELGNQRVHLVLAFVTFPVWIVAFALNKLYQSRSVERPTEEFRRILNASLLSVGVMVALSFALQFKSLSRLWVLSVLVFVPVLMVIERTVARRIFVKLRRHGLICRPILIIGTDADAIGLLHAAQRSPDLGYRVIGFVGPDDIGIRGGVSVLGGIDDTLGVLEATARDRRADLAVLGRIGCRQPPHQGTHRRRLPRRPLVRVSATSTSCDSALRISVGAR